MLCFMGCWNDWKNDFPTWKTHMNVRKTRNLSASKQSSIYTASFMGRYQNYRENKILRRISNIVWQAWLDCFKGHIWPPGSSLPTPVLEGSKEESIKSPAKTPLNAASTLVDSKADVSRNIRPFLSKTRKPSFLLHFESQCCLWAAHSTPELVHTCKVLGLLRGHRSLRLQVRLVAHQHYHHVLVGMVQQLLQPALHALVRQVFGDVVHQQGSNCTSVVPVRRTTPPS